MSAASAAKPSINDLLDFDFAAVNGTHGNCVIGVDEVGRGCLAGPLVACAVLLDLNHCDLAALEHLGDSKRLTEKRRSELYPKIREAVTAFALAERDAAWIDEHGVEPANQGAMVEAIEELRRIAPQALVLVDGNGLRGKSAPEHRAIVKGDAKSAAIACASILAKVSRDEQMIAAADAYPGYEFERNKGYGSPAHKQALRERGLTPLHRRSFCGFLEAEAKQARAA